LLAEFFVMLNAQKAQVVKKVHCMYGVAAG